MCMYISICICIYIYIYIHREREAERELHTYIGVPRGAAPPRRAPGRRRLAYVYAHYVHSIAYYSIV